MSTTIKLDRSAFLAWHDGLDENAKIEISTTIMQEFAKKHLKPLEHNSIIKNTIASAIKDTRDAANQAIQKEIQDSIGTLGERKWKNGGYEQEFSFNPKFQEKLNATLTAIIDTEERKLLYKANQLFSEKRIEIEERFTSTLDKRLKEYEDKLEEKMSAHFTAILNKFLKSGLEN